MWAWSFAEFTPERAFEEQFKYAWGQTEKNNRCQKHKSRLFCLRPGATDEAKEHFSKAKNNGIVLGFVRCAQSSPWAPTVDREFRGYQRGMGRCVREDSSCVELPYIGHMKTSFIFYTIRSVSILQRNLSRVVIY